MVYSLMFAIGCLAAAIVYAIMREFAAYKDEHVGDGWVAPTKDSIVWEPEWKRQLIEQRDEARSRQAGREAAQRYHVIRVSYGQYDCRARCEAVGCNWSDIQPTGNDAETARKVLEYRFAAQHLPEVEQREKREQK